MNVRRFGYNDAMGSNPRTDPKPDGIAIEAAEVAGPTFAHPLKHDALQRLGASSQFRTLRELAKKREPKNAAS
jgi:hypothetical protein